MTRPTGRRGLLLAALAAAVVGVASIGWALAHQESAPAPHPAGNVHVGAAPGTPPAPSGGASAAASGNQAAAAPPSQRPLGPSRPTRVRIPALGIDTPVNPIGLADDGTLAVPQPGPHLNEAAWFENSPTPGQPGPSIIEGHVDSVEGPSVFFRLGDITVGDKIVVNRQDGSVVTFRVNAVRDFKKATFPTFLVYGTDLSRSTLRVITCSDFDTAIHHHVGNEVVFAHLTHVSPAPGTRGDAE
ncbi:MAG: class F sortase [Marmoricola sp.]